MEFVDAWGAINSVLTNAIADSSAFTSTLTNIPPTPTRMAERPISLLVRVQQVLTNTSAPYFERNKDKNIFDNLSIQHGNHTIRAGLTAMWMTKTENGDAGAATFSFSDHTAKGGDPEFANFLLGQADTYTQQSKDTVPYLHYVNFEAYVQDDWKITPRLTLNLGVRYSYFPSPSDSNNTLVNFDPNKFSQSSAPAIDPVNRPDHSWAQQHQRGDLCQRAHLPHRCGLHCCPSNWPPGQLFTIRQSSQSGLE